MTTTSPSPPPKVQIVTKASSDELLRKFAEMDSEETSSPRNKASRKRELQIIKQAKRIRVDRTNRKNDENVCESSPSRIGLVERKSLLPRSNNRRCAVLRKIGIRGISQGKSREMKNRSLLGTIEKTWRKTVEGASKMFMENHYNRHKRLISDGV
ncbi:hypothetical protein ACHQM5_018690 [Ranunculus cassubicifolius]